LKQRREITGGTASFQNSPVIQAAINGWILILDGLERAERNVLPLLNNLLENREVLGKLFDYLPIRARPN
jgi:predicted ATPase with chaperone activity